MRIREYRCPDMWKVRGLRFIWRRGEQTGRRCCKKKRQLLSDGETNEGLDQIQTDGRRGLCSSGIYQKRRTYV